MDEEQNVNDPTECAFSGGEFDDGWFARVTAKCPICGRRTVEMLKGKGTLSEAWPQTIKCKNRHEFEIVPYKWTRSHKIFVSDTA